MAKEPYWDAMQGYIREQHQPGTLDKVLKVATAIFTPKTRRAKSSRSRSARPKLKGYCRDLSAGKCNPLNCGGGCGKNTRRTKWCPFRPYFIKKDDGTMSQELSADGLRLAKELKLKMMELGYG